MGLRVRKSIKLGKNTRLNLSKSGIGFSVGTKGARITKKAGGGTRTTLSVPGTGISYVKDSKKTSRRSPSRKRAKENNARRNSDKPKKKTWLWIIGWICVFPLPLTILLLRKKTIIAPIKYGIIAIAWFFYLVIAIGATSESHNESSTRTITQRSSQIDDPGVNIQEITLTQTDDLTLKIGETYTSGQVNVKVKKVSDFTPDNIVFVSENPDVATITFSEALLATTLGFEIVAVGPGETFVYVKSDDGTVISPKLKVIVPPSVLVDSISLEGTKSEAVVGETFEVSTKILPANAENKSILWSSSDETVATVDQMGNVTAKAGGSATITASSTNDVTTSFDITIDGSKHLMDLDITHSRQDDINIGDEWNFTREINGEPASGQYALAVGDTIECYAKYTELDDNPDIGEASASHTVTEEDLQNGFSISMDLYVAENGGRNSGKSAYYIVTYNFSVH